VGFLVVKTVEYSDKNTRGSTGIRLSSASTLSKFLKKLICAIRVDFQVRGRRDARNPFPFDVERILGVAGLKIYHIPLKCGSLQREEGQL
jgi:hypothetical protein